MKALIFSHQAEFIYGGEIVTLAFLKQLKKIGVEVHFASPAGPYFERAREAGAICHEVSSVQFSRSPVRLPAFGAAFAATGRELRKIILENKIEVLHATSLKAMVYAWNLGREIPVLWHHHDILPVGFTNSLWLRGLAHRAFRVLTPSAATRTSLLDAGVPGDKVAVLKNGFDLAEWRARPVREPSEAWHLGFVGELSSRKGIDRLAGIMKALADVKDLQCSVVGGGLSEPAFAEKVRANLESPRVSFLGRRSDVKALYQNFDVLLVPSRQDPLPTVIVEAGLSGVPVVAAPSGGIPEMIENGKNGFLFASEMDAAVKIREIFADWERFSRESKKIADARYDIVPLTDALLKHYQEAAKHGA